MDRQKMIEQLIEDDIDTIINSADTDYLYNILTMIYSKYTNKELKLEHKGRFE